MRYIKKKSTPSNDGEECADRPSSVPEDVCHCACHVDPGLVHIIPCCELCDRCGLRIQRHALNRHKLAHRSEKAN
jgi:hypothetical protein